MFIKHHLLVVVLVLTVLPSVQADEKRHRQLAEEYFSLSGYQKQLATFHEQSAEAYVGANQEYKDHRAAIQRAYGKVYSFEKLKPEMVQILMKHFTEEELVELIQFFKSPIGKKLFEKTPEFYKTYVEFFRKLAGQGGDALSKAIQEEIDKDK